jgi:hypothetical protein
MLTRILHKTLVTKRMSKQVLNERRMELANNWFDLIRVKKIDATSKHLMLKYTKIIESYMKIIIIIHENDCFSSCGSIRHIKNN